MSTNTNATNAIIGAILRKNIPASPRKTSARAIMSASDAGYAYDVSYTDSATVDHIRRNTSLAFFARGINGVLAVLRMDKDGNAYVCRRTTAIFNFL